MIVNHKYKFIFIKTQKTASTSLETALSSLCGPNDIVTPISAEDEEFRKSLGYQTPVNCYIPFKRYTKKDIAHAILKRERKRFYNHMPCAEIRQYVGATIYDSYYKFCFERNPYDKLISSYYYYQKSHQGASIEEFINSGKLNIIMGFDQYTINKVVAVDDIFKYEEMDIALETISKKLNLNEKLELPKVRLKSKFRDDKKHYTELINPKVKDLIDIIWARERKLMGYEFR